MTHRTKRTTWMEQLGHRKICESLCTRDSTLPETEMFQKHSGPLKISSDYAHRNGLLLSALYLKYTHPNRILLMQQKNLPSFPLLLGGVLPKERKLDLSLHHDNSPTIPFWGAPAGSSPATSWTVERMLSENLDKDKPRLMSPGKTHSLDLDLTPAQDALQKLTLWKTLETNCLWGLFFPDTLYQSITTFYKRYSIMKGFWDYVNQDKSTGNTFLNINRIRLSSLFFPHLTDEESSTI